MAQMDFFLGSWSCNVHQYAVGPRPEHRYQSTITVKPDLAGKWHSVRNESAGVTVAGYTGFHVATNKFLRVAFDSFGNMETKTSDGWQGDDWVWSGTTSVMGKEMPLRHTLTRHGEHEFFSKYETQFGTRWVLVRDELCKK